MRAITQTDLLEQRRKERSKMTADQWYQTIRQTNAPLEEWKEAKIAQLDGMAERDILSGFTSQTTGHFYRFNQLDQMNFTQQMLLLVADQSIAEVSWKTEDAGVVVHTREQFLAVTNEAEQHKRSLMERYWTLKAQAQDATTKEEVDTINW
ncbi:hypothetical protein LOK74_18945 [Brevibacillus humidisoli]|uniref:DUF4376 domain-containing protein n=1 Tax=Brevibacillus humidisoli TaxID=2895522 RepID=UPI001E50F2A1|nr:hypothetical protein [Brevibacillus humidisoli]UFJ40091.1 hypothetical protein LOK74_18945 [Brevibacillus humidisoli]